MIPTKMRDSRKSKLSRLKLPKHLACQYKEAKCREFSIMVTRMDFAKILGKFTKVKIQYQSNHSKPVIKNSSKSSSRLKSIENGIVQVQRKVYPAHPAKKLLDHRNKTLNNILPASPQTVKVLKENNSPKQRLTNLAPSKTNKNNKKYEIVFKKPIMNRKIDCNISVSLDNLVPFINRNILPSDKWCIEYFPKIAPKNDKIYDKIAAELEDIMYNEKSKQTCTEKDKIDEFPSILDILNDDSKETKEKADNQSITLQSNDVDAMLLGKSKSSGATTMVNESANVTGLLTGVNNTKNEDSHNTINDNPDSPSILEESAQKLTSDLIPECGKELSLATPNKQNLVSEKSSNNNIDQNQTNVAQVIFKKTINGSCNKTVTCPKNLRYIISIDGKSVEFIGAPQHVTSLEDLQILLQIVDKSELSCSYVLL